MYVRVMCNHFSGTSIILDIGSKMPIVSKLFLTAVINLAAGTFVATQPDDVHSWGG